MLYNRLRRWPNINPSLVQCLVFACLARDEAKMCHPVSGPEVNRGYVDGARASSFAPIRRLHSRRRVTKGAHCKTTG